MAFRVFTDNGERITVNIYAMYVLVSYDIVSNKVRRKAMKLLKDYGERMQKSVFECHLDEAQYNEVKNRLKDLVNTKEDRVRFYAICHACMGKVKISGWGEVKDDEEFVIV